MLENMNVLIMGGDARHLIVMKHLADQGAQIYLIGYETATINHESIHKTTEKKLDFSMLDAIVLPVGGTNLEGKMEATYATSEVKLTHDMIAKTPEHCVIYTGTTNAYLESLAKSHKRSLVVLFARDDLAIYNSIPTAEGTLHLAIEETDHTIHGSNVFILGFGRVGMTVAQTFYAMGAKVSVAARRSEDLARIYQLGYQAIKLADLKQHLTDIDLCINTIPYLILNKDVISVMNPNTLIIDLASAPGGTDFNFAQQKGIKAIHALGLPGKTAPKSAGLIIGKVLLDLLVEQHNKS